MIILSYFKKDPKQILLSDYRSKDIIFIMSILQPFPAHSAVRESRIIANQQTIANQTEIVTPSNARFKRTVYHTPAIIETVVDTPEIPSTIQTPIRSDILTRRPVTRMESLVTPLVLPQPQNTTYIPQRETTLVRELDYGRGLGVKVNQDMSSIKPLVIPKVQEPRGPGFCSKIIGCCWGNKCPLWLCCLIPLLVLLLLFFLSYFINRHRVFYGYDNSTNTNLNPELKGQYNQFDNSMNFGTSQYPIQPIRPKQNEIVDPVVSTDRYRSNTVQMLNRNNLMNNTLTPTSNLNENLNQNINPNNMVYQKDRNIGSTIYNRIRALQNSQQFTNTSQSRTVNRYNNRGLNQGSSVSTTIRDDSEALNQIRLAPTYQEVQTQAMIQAQKMANQHQNSSKTLTFNKNEFHLRHNIS